MKLIKYPDKSLDLTLINLFKILKFNLKAFVYIFIIVVIFSLAYYFIVPRTYVAYASIFPPESQSGGGGLSSFLQTISGGLSIGGLGGDSKALLFSDLIKSREVAKYVTDSLKLAKEFEIPQEEIEFLYELIEESIETKVNRSGLILLSATASSEYFPNSFDKKKAAKLSADIVNTAVYALDYINRNKNNSKAKKKRIYIDKVLIETKKRLDSVDNALETFQENNKVLALDEQTKAILESSVNLGAELQKAELELSLKKLDFKETSPAVGSLETTVDRLRQQYKRVQNGGLLSSEDFSIPLQNIPKLFREYTSLIRDKKILEQVNLYLTTQRFQESIQEESDVPTIEFLDKATPPLRQNSPSLKITLVLGTFLAFVILSFTIVVLAIKKKFLVPVIKELYEK